MQDIAREVRTNLLVMFSGPLHMDKQVLDDWLESIYNGSVQIQDVVKRTCQKRRMIMVRELGKSVMRCMYVYIYIYIYIYTYIHTHTNSSCPVCWGCRIHRLHLCGGVRPPSNECSEYDTKRSDSEVPVMLELWGMQCTLLLPLLPGPLWLRVLAPDRALSMD